MRGTAHTIGGLALLALVGCAGVGDGDSGAVPQRDRGMPAPTPLDADGDTISDADEAAPVRDVDGDGTPDYLDLDSDGDTVPDSVEAIDNLLSTAPPDFDADGLPDVIDFDSDNDGWLDAEEAGDADLDTPPVDTDGDGFADYRDVDSDGDRLFDSQERVLGSDPLVVDTDGDGYDDFEESSTFTDPADPGDNAGTRGEPSVTIGEDGTPTPSEVTLRVPLRPSGVDVYVLLDNSASMIEERFAFEAGVVEWAPGLVCPAGSGGRCIDDTSCPAGEVCNSRRACIEDPRVNGCVESVSLAFGTYAPGSGGFRHRVSIQDVDRLDGRRFPTFSEEDGEEALFEAVACVGEPLFCPRANCGFRQPGQPCAAFSLQRLRLLLVATDDRDRCPTEGERVCTEVADADFAAEQLRPHGLQVIGVDASADGAASADLRTLGLRSRAVDAAEGAFVRRGDGPAFMDAMREVVVDAARDIAPELSFDVDGVVGVDVDALVESVREDRTAPGCEERGACVTVTFRPMSRVVDLTGERPVTRLSVSAMGRASSESDVWVPYGRRTIRVLAAPPSP